MLVSPRLDVGETPGLWLMLYHVPTVLIALSFCLQELPQFEIPAAAAALAGFGLARPRGRGHLVGGTVCGPALQLSRTQRNRRRA